MFSKHRLAALSDGVFAIVMTLLILDIKVPIGTAPGGLKDALLADSHEWTTYAITFAISAVFWNLQRKVFDVVSEVTDVNIFLTFLFLGFVTILPFTTSLWGHHLNEPLAFILYFGNQFLIGALLTAKVEIARVKGYAKVGPEFAYVRFRLYSTCAVMASAGIAAVYLPTEYIGLVPMMVVVVSQVIKRKKFPRSNRRELPPPLEMEEESLP